MRKKKCKSNGNERQFSVLTFLRIHIVGLDGVSERGEREREMVNILYSTTESNDEVKSAQGNVL